jgi:hypothetical protein
MSGSDFSLVGFGLETGLEDLEGTCENSGCCTTDAVVVSISSDIDAKV